MAKKPRPQRDRERYFIDNTFLRGGWGAKLGPFAIAVYNAIALHANEEQEAWPSCATIANLTGMSTRQVMREVEGLAAYNIVAVKSRQVERKPAIITLLDKSEWLPPEHMTDSHMTNGLMTGSRMTYDSQSDEHMTGSHTNKTQEIKPMNNGGSDFLEDVFTLQGQTSEATAPNPDDLWFEYRDRALKAFPGNWGRTAEEKEIKRNLILGLVANTPDFNPDHWEFTIQDCIAHGVSSGNIARFIEVYPFRNYEEYLGSKYPSANGRDSPPQPNVTGVGTRTSDGGFNL